MTLTDYEIRRQQIRDRNRYRNRERIFYVSPLDVRLLPLLRGGAGSFPDHPSRRLPIDADDTIGLFTGTGNPPPAYAAGLTEYSGAQMIELNDDDETTVKSVGGGGQRFRNVFIFPELREFDGFFVSNIRATGFTMESSTDTTNGVDGTWDAESAVNDTNFTVRNEYRDEIVSAARSNRRAVRFVTAADGGGSVLKAVHLYGEPAAGETPDRLLWIDTGTNLEFVKPIDYGDIPRGSAEDRTVKLRNNSASLTASSVQITAEALYQSMASWFTFSEGGAFQATLALASSIANGADSPTITVRRVTPDSSALSLHEGRIYANIGSWA